MNNRTKAQIVTFFVVGLAMVAFGSYHITAWVEEPPPPPTN